MDILQYGSLEAKTFAVAAAFDEAAARALRKHAGDGGKLPNPAALQAEYIKLNDRKNILRGEYGKLKQQAREYGIVKKNVDSILEPGTERARGKSRNAEL